MFSFLKFVAPLLIWAWFMRDFLTGVIPVNMDTLTIYAVVKFYFNNILNGTVPLWDPFVSLGVPFYAITLCNLFSPVTLLVPLTAILTGDYYAGFILYMVAFFCLGAWGFYLLVKELSEDKKIAYIGFILLIFSSLGTSMFTQFTLLELFVPAVWFFFFLIRFYKAPSVFTLLGLSFASMSILIAYVPFYFVTFFVFFLCTLRLSWIKVFVLQLMGLIKKQTVVFVLCVVSLFSAALPLVVYKAIDSKGDIVSPGRHCQYTSAQECQEKTLKEQGGMTFKEITQSGTLSERADFLTLFKHLDKRSYGSDAFIFIPFIIFIILAVSFPLKANRLTVSLMVLIVLLLMTALGAQTPLYGFLYKTLPWMKYFRNLFFFVAYLIPLVILLACLQLKDVLALPKNSTFDKWVGVVLIAGVGGLMILNDVLPTMWVTLLLMGAVYFVRQKAWSVYAIAVIAVLMPMEVFAHYTKEARIFAFSVAKEPVVPQFNFVRPLTAPASEARIFRFVPYENFAATMLMQDTTPKVGYPNSVPRDAFILATTKGEDVVASIARHKLYWVAQGQEPQALLSQDPRIKVVRFTPNEFVLRVDFKQQGQLVYTDNHSAFWKVFIDGKEASLFKAADAFKAVHIPAGAHEIIFRYAPLGGQAVYVFVTIIFVLMLTALVLAQFNTARMKQ